jgi:hypothetical protein
LAGFDPKWLVLDFAVAGFAVEGFEPDNPDEQF